MAMIDAGFEYAMAYCKGEIEKLDEEFMLEKLKEIAGDDVLIRPIDDDNKKLLTVCFRFTSILSNEVVYATSSS